MLLSTHKLDPILDIFSFFWHLATTPQINVSNYSPTLLTWNHSARKWLFSWRRAGCGGQLETNSREGPPWLVFRQFLHLLLCGPGRKFTRTPDDVLTRPSSLKRVVKVPCERDPPCTRRKEVSLSSEVRNLGPRNLYKQNSLKSPLPSLWLYHLLLLPRPLCLVKSSQIYCLSTKCKNFLLWWLLVTLSLRSLGKAPRYI